jgi:hypothetical protein
MMQNSMKKIYYFSIFIVLMTFISCDSKNVKEDSTTDSKSNKKPILTSSISSKGFSGKYVGAEFDSKGDVGHQFSNKVTDIIGKQLKESYEKGEYLKVDFKNTKITTTGLDLKGKVEFVIEMPFLKVEKCEAFTGIEHCGTWVNQNKEKLDARLNEKLQNLKTLSVGEADKAYFHTEQGYKEYWIQFKHKNHQSICK